MPRLRTTRFQSRGGAGRRQVGWETGPRQEVPLSFSATSISIFSVNKIATSDGSTLVRMRGQLSAWLTSAGSAGDGFNQCAVGFCMVTENAAGVGATAVPDPIVDSGWDGWMYYRFLGPLISISTTVTPVDGLSFQQFEIDSKAMRKWKDTDVFMGIFSVGTEQGVAVGEFQANTRLLVKLP